MTHDRYPGCKCPEIYYTDPEGFEGPPPCASFAQIDGRPRPRNTKFFA